MTTDEFLKEFETIVEDFTWSLSSGLIWGDTSFCPITALHYKKTGELCGSSAALRIAENDYNMKSKDVRNIIRAADYPNLHEDDDAYPIRKKLLQIIGLED